MPNYGSILLYKDTVIKDNNGQRTVECALDDRSLSILSLYVTWRRGKRGDDGARKLPPVVDPSGLNELRVYT